MFTKRKFNDQEDSDDSNDSIKNSIPDQHQNNVKQNLKLKLTNAQDKSLIEKKIRKIIEINFDEEINYKKYELEKINERIFEAQNMLDKLRVCIVCNFYSLNGRLSLNEYINHPAISSLKCEHLDATIVHSKNILSNNTINSGFNNTEDMNSNENLNDSSLKSYQSNLNQQFDVKIYVGNVSKYLNNSSTNSKANKNSSDMSENIESSQYNQDLITHKWMIYIRSPNCAKLENYIKKVIFYLHSSYKPYDIIEVKLAPFQIVRRGWGEFPTHVQIHFKDPRNKRVDINHNLKLDWTQTGLQTFGGETSIITKLVMKPNDFISDSNRQSNTNNNKNKEDENNSYTNQTLQNMQEKSSNSFQNEINQCQSIDSLVQIEQSNTDSLLKRNFSSSSISSCSNSMSNFPSNIQNRSELISPNFISTEIETSQANQQFKSNNQANNQTIHENNNFDELMLNFVQPKKQDDKPKPSVDELLNIRPKSLSNSIRTPIKPIKQFNTTTLIIPKLDQSNTSNPAGINQLAQIAKTSLQSNSNGSSHNFLENIQKSTVIYKIGSDDLKNDQKSTCAQSAATSSTHSVQTGLNLNKKVKLTTEQLTKIKNNNAIITNQTKIQSIENENQNDNINKKIDPAQIYNYYSIQTLLDNLQTNKSNLTFESLIKQTLKNCPIINNLDCQEFKQFKKKSQVYTAKSIHEYYSWPYAKRKANEWIRALAIKRKCIQLIKYMNEFYKTTTNIQVWSTKSIVLWLRSHGYTPLEYNHMQIMPYDQFNRQMIQPNESHSSMNYVDSFSPINRLFNNSSNLTIDFNQIREQDLEENILIDVVNIDTNNKNKKSIKKLDKDDLISNELNSSNLTQIELCSGSQYVKEQLDMLNFKTNPVSLVPSMESPNESNVYACNLVEKLLFVLAKRFADDLIRQTCSDIYFDNYRSNLSVTQTDNVNNNNYNSLNKKMQQTQNDTLLYQKFPQNLYVLDVFNTIKKHDKYDFLTNKYMASWSSIEQNVNPSNEIIEKNINFNSNTNTNNNNSINISKSSKETKSINSLKKNYSDFCFNFNK